MKTSSGSANACSQHAAAAGMFTTPVTIRLIPVNPVHHTEMEVHFWQNYRGSTKETRTEKADTGSAGVGVLAAVGLSLAEQGRVQVGQAGF